MLSKAEYNKLLARFNKAVKWFNDPKVSKEDKDKYEPVFLDIVAKLALMVEQFKSNGLKMTDDEINNGFRRS